MVNEHIVILKFVVHKLTKQSRFKPSCSKLTLLHSEWPKLYRVLAILSAIGLMILLVNEILHFQMQM